ncbi:DUF4384 domain-containing protein [Comamonas odontotermitis]|uniref:DUF4384 domain-containing protein n=1 Tax=Comamonas odontotermitis TaxID=379895 RepID=UPI001CC5F54D|nr:DUF4384 domain-containing protein [Comamonas odontotermitis]UBB17574.1 DUF4384 domain-containing protein [Comamonas odontotermitis]
MQISYLRHALLWPCVLALSACAIDPGLSDRKDIIEKGITEQTPLVTPTKSASAMREGLACMDRMLAAEQVPATLIAVKSIPDPSGLFSTGTKEMLITAISRMSRTSQAFRVVDYEVDALKQDTVQTMTSLLLNNGQIELRKPQIYISGAISFGDKTVVSKRRSIGVSTANTDTGYSWDVLGSVVGLDLHLGDMNSRTLYPGLDSANELVVATGGKGVEIGGRATGLPKHIYRMGVQYEVAADNNQGAGAAVRLLVDLAAIELVGKWAKIPYWQCIDYEQNHPEFKRQMRAWYEEQTATDRINLAQRVLQAQGVWSGPVDGNDSTALRNALATYQASLDMTPVGTVNFETYTGLLRNYVGMSAEDKLASSYSPQSNELKLREHALPMNEPAHNGLTVALLGQKEPRLQIGNSVVLRIAPARSGFLYCYYKDAANVVSQIYPNPQQQAVVAQGNMGLMVPDVSQSNSFLIETARAGTEQVYCAMTAKPLTGRVPAALTNAKLEPLVGVTTIETVQQQVQAQEGVIAQSTLQWEVEGPVVLAPAVPEKTPRRGKRS